MGLLLLVLVSCSRQYRQMLDLLDQNLRSGGKLPGSTAVANTTARSPAASCSCTAGGATAKQSLWQWSGQYFRTL
jgi:hypothetical protein